MGSRLLLAFVSAATGIAAAGCSVAYVPGDVATTPKAGASDPSELRRQVQVLANRCSDTKLGGVVTNRSSAELSVVVEAQMYTPAGVPKSVTVTVDAVPAKTVVWSSAAPAGTTAAGGCQAYAKTITVLTPG